MGMFGSHSLQQLGTSLTHRHIPVFGADGVQRQGGRVDTIRRRHSVATAVPAGARTMTPSEAFTVTWVAVQMQVSKHP